MPSEPGFGASPTTLIEVSEKKSVDIGFNMGNGTAGLHKKVKGAALKTSQMHLTTCLLEKLLGHELVFLVGDNLGSGRIQGDTRNLNSSASVPALLGDVDSCLWSPRWPRVFGPPKFISASSWSSVLAGCGMFRQAGDHTWNAATSLPSKSHIFGGSSMKQLPRTARAICKPYLR